MPKETNCDCPEEFYIEMEYPYDHPDHYDGISEKQCRKCGKRVGRWSGRVLAEGETEPRWGERRC